MKSWIPLNLLIDHDSPPHLGYGSNLYHLNILPENVVNHSSTVSVSLPLLSSQSNVSYTLSGVHISFKALSLGNFNDNIDSYSTLKYPSPTNKLQIFIKQI